jgi:hypothetical protein
LSALSSPRASQSSPLPDYNQPKPVAFLRQQQKYDIGLRAVGIRDDKKGPPFRSAHGRTGMLTSSRMHLVRGATATGLIVHLGHHSFRATGITTYLNAGGTLTLRSWLRMKPALDEAR